MTEWRRKAFDAGLNERCDIPARAATVACLIGLDIPLEERNKTIEPDLYLPELDVFLELEVREVWTRDSFPFPTANVLKRKYDKYSGIWDELGISESTLLVSMNSECSRGFIITPAHLHSLDEVPLRCRVEGEWVDDLVKQVPINQCFHFSFSEPLSLVKAIEEGKQYVADYLRTLEVCSER